MTPDQAAALYGQRVRQLAHRYYLPGADREDVEQEAMVGLVEAVRNHQPGKGPFEPFLFMVVTRHLLTMVTAANREKHRVLTDSQREIVHDEYPPLTPGEAVPDRRADTETLADNRRVVRNIFAHLPRLTDMERRCIVGFACGLTYDEVSERTGVHRKGVNNSIQRARVKLRAVA